LILPAFYAFTSHGIDQRPALHRGGTEDQARNDRSPEGG
jgi:hypothetical protein